MTNEEIIEIWKRKDELKHRCQAIQQTMEELNMELATAREYLNCALTVSEVHNGVAVSMRQSANWMSYKTACLGSNGKNATAYYEPQVNRLNAWSVVFYDRATKCAENKNLDFTGVRQAMINWVTS